MTEDGEEEEGAMVTSEGGKAPPYTSDASGDGNGVWMDVAVYDEPSPWATGDCMFDKSPSDDIVSISWRLSHQPDTRQLPEVELHNPEVVTEWRSPPAYPGYSLLPCGYKRKRTSTPSQRLAANVRERKRMYSLNEAFEMLRPRVPVFEHEKRLSRIQTLKLAMHYIDFMTNLLNDDLLQCPA